MALVLIIATFILVTYESCIVDITSPPKLWDSLPTRKLETHLFWAMILHGVSPSGFYTPPPPLSLVIITQTLMNQRMQGTYRVELVQW